MNNDLESLLWQWRNYDKISKDFNWTFLDPISFVCNEITNLWIVRKISASLYVSFILVCFIHTSHNVILCGLALSPHISRKYFYLQKRFVRMATFSSYYDATTLLFMKCNVLSIFDDDIFQIYTLPFKSKHLARALPDNNFYLYSSGSLIFHQTNQ